MSTQAARNIIKSQLEQVISTAKTRIKDEGRKKLVELKQQIPTPSELVKNEVKFFDALRALAK